MLNGSLAALAHGSHTFPITFAKSRSSRGRPPSSLGWYLETEAARRLDEPETWIKFRQRVDHEKSRLLGS